MNLKTKILNSKRIEALKKYLKKESSVILAFIFGSRQKGLARDSSDWDIGIYFKPKTRKLEWEEEKDYPQENRIWGKITEIMEREVDLVVLNRVPSILVFNVLTSGFPLLIKDRKIYLDLLERTSYEAIDFRNFIFDFWKIKQRAQSLNEEDKTRLLLRIDFLENEVKEFDRFQHLTWKEYQEDTDKRRIVERWIENMINASLDIAKIILAAEKKLIPKTYQATLKDLGTTKYFDIDFTGKFSQFARLRNILAHEYLDIRWKDISDFLKRGRFYLEKFLTQAKKSLTQQEKRGQKN